LKARVGGERIEIVVSHAEEVETARAVLARVADGVVELEGHTRRLTAPVTGGAKVLTETLRHLDSAGVELQDVALRRPTLDDVFLTLTGHRTEEEPTERPEPVEVS
jgi:ABC-2 type transport system ATP-binding protein